LHRDLRPKLKPRTGIKDLADYARIRLKQLEERNQKLGKKRSPIRSNLWRLQSLWLNISGWLPAVFLIIIIPLWLVFIAVIYLRHRYEQRHAAPKRHKNWALHASEGRIDEALKPLMESSDYEKRKKAALEIWAAHKDEIVDEMRSKEVSRELAWPAGYFKEQPKKLTSEELCAVIGIRLRTHISRCDERVRKDIDFILKLRALKVEHQSALCIDFFSHSACMLEKHGANFLDFQRRFMMPTMLIVEYLTQHLLREDHLEQAHRLLVWRSEMTRQNEEIEQTSSQLESLDQLLSDLWITAHKQQNSERSVVRPSVKIFPVITDLGSDVLFDCSGRLSRLFLVM